MISFDQERQYQIECLFDKKLGILNLYDNTQLQQAMVARLAEKVLGPAISDLMISNDNDLVSYQIIRESYEATLTLLTSLAASQGFMPNCFYKY